MESREKLEIKGYLLQEHFISQQECQIFLKLINNYRQQFSITKIYRDLKPIPLSYAVIDGKEVDSRLPEIKELYEVVNNFIDNLTGTQLFPLNNIQVGCNVNITEPGGTYRWHYDRNWVTAILYLNEVDGGEIDLYPNYRVLLPQGKFSRFQSFLDQLLKLSLVRHIFGQRIVVKPQPGLLLVMCGDKCLHSVRPVTDTNDRINIVMAYDVHNASFAIANQLDTYLYSSENVHSSDPNYLTDDEQS